MSGALHVVSNRLPITVQRSEDGKYSTKKSSGGLVTGLSGLSRADFQWYGWPGVEVLAAERDRLTETLRVEHNAVPILLDESLADKHYNGFSSRYQCAGNLIWKLTVASDSILWPLFHYQPGMISFNFADWIAYCEVNRLFAKELAARVSDGDMVWVHDYHLMLLPAMLREETARLQKSVTIGFFLHTPFPCDEMFMILPVRNEILEGILHSDLIGFHCPNYAENFVQSCKSILNQKPTSQGVTFRGVEVSVGVYPIGINPQTFISGLEKAEVKSRMRHMLQERSDDMKVILGVDRLDYIKGIPQKLYALEQFLRSHPDQVGKVKLVQVAVPSRQSLKETKELTVELDSAVARINKEFGNDETGYQPIDLMHTSVPFEDLLAMYALADICMVSSTRDGMNLVAYEYIASQFHHPSSPGVLILSEFAGAASSLEGSLLVNPWNVNDLASAIHTALTMPRTQRVKSYEKARTCVMENTSENWGKKFVDDLKRVVRRQNGEEEETVEIHLTKELTPPATPPNGLVVKSRPSVMRAVTYG